MFRLVLGAFDKVPEDRRCYRLVGGVLVERTVKDFRPVVEDNKARVATEFIWWSGIGSGWYTDGHGFDSFRWTRL